MSGSPRYKIYNRDGDYMAAAKEAAAAAVLVSWYGKGATIKDDHGPIIWREGSEVASARDSFDTCAETMWARIDERAAKFRERMAVLKASTTGPTHAAVRLACNNNLTTKGGE